jgi:hypothetical protein
MISIEDIGQLVHQATTKKKNSKYELLSNWINSSVWIKGQFNELIVNLVSMYDYTI